MPTQKVRVRFAPSPTGYLHVGGARTALFNWLFARHQQGTFILRIEDTDFERSSEEMVEGILAGMQWLGLDWDEGPFYQSKRLELYEHTSKKLLDEGSAYRCFCTKDALEQRRSAAHTDGRTPKYDGTCRRLSPGQVSAKLAAAEAFVVRFAVPDGGSTVVEDAVFGKVEFSHAELEDFVLMRSDAIPTYHLSVVADDIDMRMTHIIRGADHLSNTPKQILLYRALGAELPVFAHVPLILGPDKTRLSKRHGATSVMSYREEGIVPEAFRNFLALLGWTPESAAKEIMTDAELIAAFTLEGVATSDAVFDRAKLDWFNTEHIRRYPADRLLPLIEEEWKTAGVNPDPTDREWLLSTIDLLKPRARSLKDFAVSFRGYFSDDYENDPAAVDKFLFVQDNIGEMLGELAARYSSSGDFSEATAEKVLRDLASERNVKAGVLINAARVALTGQGVAPSLFTVMMILGRDKTIRRLRAAKDPNLLKSRKIG